MSQPELSRRLAAAAKTGPAQRLPPTARRLRTGPLHGASTSRPELSTNSQKASLGPAGECQPAERELTWPEVAQLRFACTHFRSGLGRFTRSCSGTPRLPLVS